MVNWVTTVNELRASGLTCEAWGDNGETAAASIEVSLGVQLPNELASFIQDLGNLRIDPFDLCIVGDSQRRVGAVASTEAFRENTLDAPVSAVQIMEHAGELFLLMIPTGEIVAYEAARPVLGEETLRWGDFIEFFDWIVREARQFQSGSEFAF